MGGLNQNVFKSTNTEKLILIANVTNTSSRYSLKLIVTTYGSYLPTECALSIRGEEDITKNKVRFGTIFDGGSIPKVYVNANKTAVYIKFSAWAYLNIIRLQDSPRIYPAESDVDVTTLTEIKA